MATNGKINVGVTYTKQFIERGINTEYSVIKNQDQLESEKAIRDYVPEEAYTCIGLLFRGMVENNFTVDALLFSNKKNMPFHTIPLKNDLENPIYIANENGSLHLRKVSSQLNEKKENHRVQFWDAIKQQPTKNKGPFVYFGKHTLGLLTTGDVKTVSFSGATVNYGIGIRNYRSVANENSTIYPTLKAEVDIDTTNKNQYIPTAALGLPCPPQWSDGERSLSVKLTNDDIRFLGEMRSNFYAYEEKTRNPIRALKPEPTLEEMMVSWNDLKIN